MKTDIENKEQRAEQKKEGVEQKKEKKEKKTNKEQISIIKNFLGKDVDIKLRNGNNLKGKLETVAQYELVITMSYTPVIVMKHAVDYIMLTDEK